jgi:hypothetical protein
VKTIGEEEGWGKPARTKKWHYFVGIRSLCGRWAYRGELEQGNDDSPDNCAACRKKLEKRKLRS